MIRLVAFIAVLFAVPLQAAELRVGFAESDVSPKLDPKKPVYMAGFGQNRKATKIHDPIMARGFVLADGDKKIAFVCVDVVGLFLPFVERVRAKLPEFAGVTVSSTHNHEGPDTMGLWGSSPFTSGINPEYMKYLESEIVKVIREAEKKLQPVTAFIGKTNTPDLITDTRQPIILHDELVALKFVDASKKTVGIVIQWNCHPETLDDKNTEISADYVGSTVAEVREKHKCPVVYLTGTVGGLMTSLRVPVKNDKGEDLKDGTFEKADRYGRLVGKAANTALEKVEPITLTPFDVRKQGVVLPVDNKLYQLAWQLGVLKRDIVLTTDDPYNEKPIVAKDLSEPTGIRTEVGLWTLGELSIAMIPGEIYPELVLNKVPNPAPEGADFPDAPIEPAIYAQLKTKHRMIIGLCNDELGYMLPKRQWDEKAPFTYGRTKAPYGEVNSLGPQTGPLICETFRRLAK